MFGTYTFLRILNVHGNFVRKSETIEKSCVFGNPQKTFLQLVQLSVTKINSTKIY